MLKHKISHKYIMFWFLGASSPILPLPKLHFKGIFECQIFPKKNFRCTYIYFIYSHTKFRENKHLVVCVRKNSRFFTIDCLFYAWHEKMLVFLETFSGCTTKLLF